MGVLERLPAKAAADEVPLNPLTPLTPLTVDCCCCCCCCRAAPALLGTLRCCCRILDMACRCCSGVAPMRSNLAFSVARILFMRWMEMPAAWAAACAIVCRGAVPARGPAAA